jgi:hypothetical protein
MLQWIKIRDPETCEVYHELYDHNLQKTVAWINNIDKMYRVQILDHAPFHSKKLNIAKSAGQHVYEHTCC